MNTSPPASDRLNFQSTPPPQPINLLTCNDLRTDRIGARAASLPVAPGQHLRYTVARNGRQTCTPQIYKGWLLCLAFLLTVNSAALADVLRIGTPTIENNRYIVPILLNGSDGSVAALDFCFRYDPAVFRAVTAERGAAAIQANKMVTANAPVPGSYNVVMMGLNQTTVGTGEVARVVLERLDDAQGSTLRIDEPTLATADGQEIAATGSSRRLGDQTQEEPREPEAPAEPAPVESPVEASDSPVAEAGQPESGRSGFPGFIQQLPATLPEGVEVKQNGFATRLAREAEQRQQVAARTARAVEENTVSDTLTPSDDPEAGEKRFNETAAVRMAQVDVGPVTIESNSREGLAPEHPGGLPMRNAGTPADTDATRRSAMVWGALVLILLAALIAAVFLRRRFLK